MATARKNGHALTAEVERLGSRAGKAGERAIKKGQRQLEKFQETGADAWDNAISRVETRPVESLGIAVLVGIAIGMMLILTRSHE
jgi:ElaB/YqjD/DUF883 family membrane-anchored ribosome-binding protein